MKKASFSLLIGIFAVLMLTACGGGGGGGGAAAVPTYTVGGTLTGLSGSVVLQNNGGDDLTITTNGAFTFGTALADGGAYDVQVTTQPAGQVCTASSNTGTISGANVTSVSVVCSSNTFTIGGTVSGLDGTLVLRNNGGDDLAITTNGTFTFGTALAGGGAYNVQVTTQPLGQTCTASSNTGTISGANVTSVSVVCSSNTFTIGGTVSGLDGTLVLRNNGGDDLAITTNGTFTFGTAVAGGAGYGVTVFTQPEGQDCSVVGGSGTATANVTTVNVQCVTLTAPALNANPLSKSVDFSWNDTGASSYDLYYSTSQNCDIGSIAGCPGGAVVTGVTSPYTLSNLTNGQHYTFWLKANHSGGQATVSQSGARPDRIAAYNITSLATGADGTVYLGGYFTRVGASSGGGVPLRTTSVGTYPFPVVLGTVRAVVSDGSGGWYIGGTFTRVGTELRNNIAHILADGSVSPWNPDADGEVWSLALSGTTVYAGGWFTNIGGQTRYHIAALDTTVDTNNATDWNPNAADGGVYALAVSGTTVYAGGDLANIGGRARKYIAAFDSEGNLTDWDPNANSTVFALVVSGTTVYAGGGFSNIGGQARNRIAALDAAVNTNNATDWNPNATSGTVYALAVSGTTIYAGGDFTNIGGQARSKIAALDMTVNTSNASGWDPNADGTVRSIAVSGSTVYVGGLFTNIGGTGRNRIAALDMTVNTNNATDWNPNANNTVAALAVSGSTVYAGGQFTSIGGAARNNIAALSTSVSTNNATDWDPNANNWVSTLAVSGTTVYVGGGFGVIGGQDRDFIAALDATSGAATEWNPNPNNSVIAIAVTDTTVYAGGGFTSIEGEVAGGFAALAR